MHDLKLELGCGHKLEPGFTGIDKLDFSKELPTGKFILRDIEYQGLPFCDDAALEIRAFNIFEHVNNLEFVLNECWRVLRKDGLLYFQVPHWGSKQRGQDPTHVRGFSEYTFTHYFGEGMYNFKPWFIESINEMEKHQGIIEGRMRPNK